MTMSMPEQDLERGQAMSPPPPAPPMTQPQSSITHYPSGMFQADNQYLTAFRYHLGIQNDPSLNPQEQGKPSGMGGIASMVTKTFSSSNTTNSSNPTNRIAPNLGIYQRVVAAEQQCHKEYRTWSILINSALGLQIIFAAALTALGAGNGPHSAITAFGAMNTVLAGLLTFLKGSGLPNRIKYYENLWTKLREYIEQRERDFASECLRGRISWEEVTDEIAIIGRMYDSTRRDIEQNTPEGYISLMNHNKDSQPRGTSDDPALSRGLSQLTRRLPTVKEGFERAPADMEHRIRSNITETDSRFSRGWSDLEKRATAQVREIGNTYGDHIADTRRQAETQLANTQTSLEQNLDRTRSTAQSRLNDAQGAVHTSYHDAGDSVASRLGVAQQKFTEAQSRLSATHHDAEAKLKEIEQKVSEVAEKTAERVLEFTRHQHQNQNPSQSQTHRPE